jgi:hypothetical protein
MTPGHGKTGSPNSTLVVLTGPPAVGKMATGMALSQITGFPLFHNHMSVELVLPFFPFGSSPFVRLVGEIRRRIFEEVSQSPHEGLIFTWAWALDEPEARDFIDEAMEIFAARGGRTVFAELRADLENRLRRNRTELRLQEKPSKRDVVASEARLLAADDRYRMNSDGDFPFPDLHLSVDNSHLEPEEVAARIARHFNLLGDAR